MLPKNLIISAGLRFFKVIYCTLFVVSISVGQNASKYPKEVKVNWDTKIFEDSLPIDQSFILSVYSAEKLPDNLVLMRYIDKGFFLYFEQPITKIKDEQDLPIASITKQTITKTETGGSSTTQTITEYNGDPSKKAPRVVKYRVSPLRANFYYALMAKTDFDAGNNSEKISESGLEIQKEKGAIADSYLSYQDFSRRRVTAIIGVAYSNAESKIVRPYLGLRYNFYPINTNYQSRYYEDMHLEGSFVKKVASRLSLDLGVTLASVQDSARGQYNLFGNNNLVTGLGLKVADGFFISSGALWYNKKEDFTKPTSPLKINAAWFFSLSFDWDFGRSLDALKKALGAP